MDVFLALAFPVVLAVTSWFWGVDSRGDNVSLFRAPSERRY